MEDSLSPKEGYIKGKMCRIDKRFVWEKRIEKGSRVFKEILNPERAPAFISRILKVLISETAGFNSCTP
uniref:Uncharacterized protein n=1 Tax=Rhizophora mucronata TaxID=61149 RepID=A0A2P2MWG1_RHIMU